MSREVIMIAILRGLTVDRAPETGAALMAAGFRHIEVPLNSPRPFRSIELLARAHPDCVVGAGTVLSTEDVDQVRAAGGRLIVAPNCDPQVIRHALACGMRVMPGIATATEAFAAVQAGATELKLFPASTYGAGHLRALKSVLPESVKVYPVGGIGSQDIAGWLESGADGFGFGGELFKPAYTLADVAARAKGLFEALHTATSTKKN
jgi:2-dehydro-3-deoxyphosphogalactonate aldolase